MKIIEKEFNAITGKETIAERDATEAEIAEQQAFLSKVEAIAAAEIKASAAKQAVLAKLGLTADEVAALLG